MSDRALLCKLADEWVRMAPSDRKSKIPYRIEKLLEEAHDLTRSEPQRCMCIGGREHGIHDMRCPARVP